MSIDVEITGATELTAKFSSMGAKLRARLVAQIANLQNDLVNDIKGELSGDLLRVRTGNLRNSIVAGSVEESDTRVSGKVGTNTIYARIQEEGGTITPKSAAHLTIPLDAVMTAAGVARYTARQVIASPAIGGFTGTFARKGVIFGKSSKGITALFALKDSVTIPAHRYMAKAISTLRPKAQVAFSQAVDEALKE